MNKLERLVLLLPLAGVACTLLVLDLDTQKPFRDTKDFLFLWLGGAVGTALGASLLRKGIRLSLGWIFPVLLPLFVIALWRMGRSLFAPGMFGSMEPGLPVETDYLLRLYSFGAASLFLFLAAASQELTRKKVSFIGAFLAFVIGIETVGVAIEIAGGLMGFDWHPFLGGSEVDGGQEVLKTNYFGSLGNTNFLAGYLAIGLYPVLGFSLAARRGFLRWAGFLLAGTIVLVVLLCQSKGALLGVLFGGIALALFRRSNLHGSEKKSGCRTWRPLGGKAKWIGIAMVPVLAVVVGVALLSARTPDDRRPSYVDQWTYLLDLRGESLSNRVLLAYTGIEMWKDDPWVGIGPGEFRLRFLETLGAILEGEDGPAFGGRVERLKSFKPVHLHNDLLEVWVEWGAIGYGSVLAFLLLAVARVSRVVGTERGPVGWFRIGAASGFAAGLGYGLFEFPFHLSSHLPLLAVLLGYSVAETSSGKRQREVGGLGLWMGQFTGVGFVVLSAVLLWQGMAICVASHLWAAAWSKQTGKKANMTEGFDFAKRSALLDPGNGELGLLLGQFQWMVVGRPALAINTLRRSSAICDDPLANLLEAQIALDEGRLQDAGHAISPLRGVAAYLLGMGYLEGRIAEAEGDDEAAAEAYERDVRATGRFPNPERIHTRLPDLHLRYGGALERLGRYRESIGQYEKHIETIADRGSNIPEALLRIGRIYRDRFQDYTSAGIYFEKALESARRHSSGVQIDLVLEERRELERLIQKIRAASPQTPEDVGE